MTNWIIFQRLPHELQLEPECYLEDIEAIKTMKAWMDVREEKERKKQESKKRMREKMRSGH
jgi:hypothetical protein